MSIKSQDTAQTAPGDGEPAQIRHEELRIRVIRDVAELASVRDAWLRMQTDQVLADPDFFEAALRADPRIVRPHVVVLERAGEPVAMLVARIEQLDLSVRAGYGVLYAPHVHSITVVYGGILGDADEASFRLLLTSVRESLAAGEADVAIFRWLKLDSHLYRIASTEPPRLSRQHAPSSEIHWDYELPDSSDAVLGALSSTTRQKVKRYMRKFEQEYEGRFALRIFTEPAELDELFAAVEQVAEKTYQRALGVSFGDTAAHRERTLASMRNGWFRGYVVTIDGRAVAFHHGELYGGRFRLGRPGYDPELADLRLGTYLLVRLLEDLCRDPNARVLDYGVGDAEYKSRFGTSSWREGNVLVYATTFRGVRINLTRSALLTGVGAAKRVLDRGDVARSLKQRWRRRLNPGNDAPTLRTKATITSGTTSIRVVRDLEGLAAVREAWARLQGDHISSDPDYFEAGLRSDPLIVRPQVYVLERDSEPAAMLIGRIESLDLGVRLGYRTLYAPHVSSITIVYGGILGDVDEGAFRALLGAVRGSLAAGDADVAIFRYLDVTSPCYRIASGVPGLLARGHAQPREIHWEVELRPSFEEFVASLPADGQKAMSARFKRLTRDFRDRLEVRRTTEPADVDEFFRDVGTVAVKTYQHALGVAFEDTPAHRERARICAEHGWFRGYVLRLDGQPVAFEHGELYHGRYRGSPGYDLAFAQYRPGAYLATRVFADLCEDGDARIFDYGVGDADYKQALGTHSRHESNVVLYAPTFRSSRINLTRTALQAGVAATKRVLDRGDLAHTVKKRWRDRLSRPR